MGSLYANAGVDTGEADAGVAALVSVLRTIDPGRSSRSVVPSGHYASVLEIAPNLGVAICTDGVGSKLIVAEQTGRYDTVGIDCIAMNVNDLICVGAEPIALLDYIAVEQSDPEMLGAIGVGLKAGAEASGIEIPGGELAQLPELIKGQPSPNGIDLVGACFGTVALDQLVLGKEITVGDIVIGVPATGVHSNGLTLARKALLDDGGLGLDEQPSELEGDSVADVLLEPTAIYVRAALELIRSDLALRGLAHITGGGLTNMLRLNPSIGFEISDPLDPNPVFDLIAKCGGVDTVEMYEVFNMGCGLCAVVSPEDASAAVALLASHHPGARQVGTITNAAGQVTAPGLGITGDRDGLRAT